MSIQNINILTEESLSVCYKLANTLVHKVLGISSINPNEYYRLVKIKNQYKIVSQHWTLNIKLTKFGRENKQTESPDIIIDYNGTTHYIEYTKVSLNESGNNLQYQRATKYFTTYKSANKSIKNFFIIDNEDKLDYYQSKSHIFKNYKSIGIQMIHTNPVIQSWLETLEVYKSIQDVEKYMSGTQKNKKLGAVSYIDTLENCIQINNYILYQGAGKIERKHDPNTGRLVLILLNIHRALEKNNENNITEVHVKNCLRITHYKNKNDKIVNALKHISKLFSDINIKLYIINDELFKLFESEYTKTLVEPKLVPIPQSIVNNTKFHMSSLIEFKCIINKIPIIFAHHPGSEMSKISWNSRIFDWEKHILKPNILYQNGGDIEVVESGVLENVDKIYSQIQLWLKDKQKGAYYWKTNYFNNKKLNFSIALYSDSCVIQPVFKYDCIKYMLYANGILVENSNYKPIELY